MDNLIKKEKEKYNKAWKTSGYNLWSNESIEIWNVIEWLKKKPIRKILIVGCGEGYGIHWLTKFGFDVYGLDIVNVLKFPEYNNKFNERTIWDSQYKDKEFDACISIDTLEHIQTDKMVETLNEIKRISNFFYFAIACREDSFSKKTKEKLHLTVKPPSWWLHLIQKQLVIENYHGGTNNIIVKGVTDE